MLDREFQINSLPFKYWMLLLRAWIVQLSTMERQFVTPGEGKQHIILAEWREQLFRKNGGEIVLHGW